MPLSISELVRDRRTIYVPYYNQLVEVTYKPQLYTVAMAAAANTMPVVEWLVTLVDTWDVTDADGTIWPITTEKLLELPLRLLSDIGYAIVQDVRLGEAQSSTGGGSQPAGSSGSHSQDTNTPSQPAS